MIIAVYAALTVLAVAGGTAEACRARLVHARAVVRALLPKIKITADDTQFAAEMTIVMALLDDLEVR